MEVKKSAVNMGKDYRNLDDQVSLNIRNIKMALRRLRKYTRISNELEFDLKNTISSTSKNGEF